jgi:DNA ligase-1
VEAFTRLFEALDRTTSTNAKVAAVVAYLRVAPPADAAWALFFLTGRRLLRLLPTRLMHEWMLACTQLPEWIVQESYGSVGDYAEAVALLLDASTIPRAEWPSLVGNVAPPRQAGLFDEPAPPVDTRVDGVGLAEWIETRLLPLRHSEDEERRRRVVTWWSRLSGAELLLFNKLLTGEFRVGVSRTLVVRALAEVAAVPPAVAEHRLMGEWEPSAAAFRRVVAPEGEDDQPSHPYPFFLASPLEDAVESLGARDEWLAEWKWDGIRAQAIHRSGQVFLWSRGEELLTTRFPEIATAAQQLPDGTVLDGEIVAYADERPQPFAELQRRIGRERRVAEVARDVPVAFIAYDLIEQDGVDIREQTLRDRRRRLASMVGATASPVLQLSPEIVAADWPALAALRLTARARHVEGLMLKRWTSGYRVGRRRGDWWKWKIDPFTIDAVLIYAQPGSGRRATLFTDYTFAVWDNGELVPVAKAYSGLTDAEIDELDRWIRRHTRERFGPVSAVDPVHVFELGFERIARSTRHKSGIALRFPRMLRWRRDKPAAEADTLETLEALVANQT